MHGPAPKVTDAFLAQFGPFFLMRVISIAAGAAMIDDLLSGKNSYRYPANNNLNLNRFVWSDYRILNLTRQTTQSPSQ